MSERLGFFENPILNSPYEEPRRHWELIDGVPTGNVVEERRKSAYVTPVARIRRETVENQLDLFGAADEEDYKDYRRINEIREEVAKWRSLPESSWGVTPETARLLRHWRSHDFKERRPFFCQIEAVEVYIWLTEVAPRHPQWKEMLKAGMAWHYKKYDSTPAYAQAESEARAAKRGLWQDKNPTEPEQFRKAKRAKNGGAP